jgi:serine/threonine protein kinase
VQEIISQQDDFQDLLRERERELAGKVLGSRYQIVNVLGSGGFSETYTARDMQRPGNPICVVKQLQVKTDNPKTIRLARRLFGTEAETLEKLGHHDQIPQLMAFFEEAGDFYLIQEFIAGRSLAEEFRQRHSFPECYVVDMINDLLRILDYVHQQDVIHRDLKPSNIIRRQSDQRLVLIDFGVAKKISTQLAESSSDTKFTVAVGTPGYMPGEQSAGRPHFNSDIYALGVIAIEALTGQNPRMLHHDSKTGTILWKHRVPGLTPALATIVDRMVHHDFTQRYKTAQQVQAAIAPMISDMSDVILGESEDDDYLSFPSHSSKRSLHPSQLQTVIADYSQDNLLAFDSEGTTIFPDQTVTLEDGSEEPVPLDKGVTDHVVTEPLTGPYASTEPSAPYLNQTVDQQDTQVDHEDPHL